MRGEYFTDSNEANLNVFGVKWYTQVFTIGNVGPKNTFIQQYLKLKLLRVGSPGTVTVSIRATDANKKPTGSDLASGTINGNTLTDAAAGAWYKIGLNLKVVEANEGVYAIVVRAPSGDISNCLRWRTQSGTNSYTGGAMGYSGDSGATWVSYAWDDFDFEVYGVFVDESQFHKLKQACSRLRGNPSFDVTRSALSLGDRDDTTGWYAKSYTDTTIQMVVIQKESQNVALEMGYWVSLDALGLTSNLVEVYDLIKDSFERTWEVKAVKPIIVGHFVYYFVCDLKEMPLYVS